MPFDPLWVPIIGLLVGTIVVLVIVAFAMERRLEERRLQVHYEFRRMDQEWEAARERARKP